MGGSAIPLNMPPEKSPAKVKPEQPAVEKPKAIPKASNSKKKNVRKAQVEAAPAKKPVEEEEGFFTKTLKSLVGSSDDTEVAASESSQLQKAAGKKAVHEQKEEEGLFTKTLKSLVGDDDDKKNASSKSPPAKTVKKIPAPEKEEEGLLTKTLKSLVGDDKKEVKATEKTTLNPITMAPTGSTTQNKEEEHPKTAKSETKQTLKDSFEKLIGVGAVKDDGASQSVKTDKPAGETKSAKKEESGGLLEGILGGSDKKDSPQQAKADGAVKESPAPARPARITAKKYIEEEEAQNEEEQLEKNRGGVKKGKNVLKESFKTLITDDKQKEEE